MIVESIFALALSIPADPSLKCGVAHVLPGYPEKSAVMLIDGEIRGSNLEFSKDDLDPSDIQRLEIHCWNPDTDELPAARGVQLIVIGTRQGEIEAEAATLEAARLLHAFVAEHGEVPTSLERVDVSLSGYTLEVGELGWTLTSPDINGLACSTSQARSRRDEVGCGFAYSVVRQRLRAAWEQGKRAF